MDYLKSRVFKVCKPKRYILFILIGLMFISTPVRVNAKFLSFNQSSVKDVTNVLVQNDIVDENKYIISSVEVTAIQNENLFIEPPMIDKKVKATSFVDWLLANYNSKSTLGNIIFGKSKLLTVGKMIFNVIKAGIPVVNTDFMNQFSVLPTTKKEGGVFFDMENWSLPKVQKFHVSFKNLYGISVVDFVYSIIFQYNGTLNQKGQYLAGVQLSASNISVLWGFKLDASTSLDNVSNLGSKENPIAGAKFTLKYNIRGLLKNIQTTESFFVSGSGQLVKL